MRRRSNRSHQTQVQALIDNLRANGLVIKETGVDLECLGVSKPPMPEILAAWSEKEFTAEAISMAQLYGWKVAHFRPAWDGDRMRTAVQGDGAGFPDLICCHERLGGFAVELKVKKNKAEPLQKEWLRLLESTGYLVGIYYPADWSALEERFRYGRDGKASEAERRHLVG